MELMQRLITRAKAKRMEEEYKGKIKFGGFEDQEQVPRLLIIYAINKDYSREQLRCVLLQGPAIRAIARKMEEEHRGKIAGFKKIIQDLALQVIGDQEEDLKKSKTFLFSRVLNVIIMCAWKSNLGEYVRYHKGCSYGTHNQGGMLMVESTIVVPISLQEDKIELVTSLLVLDHMSILLISAMREIELR
ncbi:hypothetical protein M9H77_23218 [Catharanthus roseus]|uniref:Uncharacterized protein n=1 Tax=Catharanthus roseus TaxID=4058 RepID=A0ACC0ASP7_CATRO|nr:hypothetical protein M9H77_23218 [Catharanthus roseus]